MRGVHRWRQWGVDHSSERRRRLVDHLLVAFAIILQVEEGTMNTLIQFEFPAKATSSSSSLALLPEMKECLSWAA